MRAQPRDIHVEDGDQIEVHYKVWDADTDEQLDEGDLLVTAGTILHGSRDLVGLQ